MPNIRTSIAALALAAAAFPVTSAQAGDPPVKVSQAAAAKGQQTVVVGAFNIGFIFKSVDNGKATGGLIGAFGGATKANSELVGVTPEMMQAITDAAYDDFKAQLTAKGYSVVDPAGFFASPEMAKAKPSEAPFEVKVQLEKNSNGRSLYYKPTALPRQYFLPGDVTTAQGGMFSGFAAMGPAMQAGQVAGATMMYAKANSQAVISVAYLIDFSQVKRPGAFSFGMSGIKVNSGMAVVDEYSKVSMVTPAGKIVNVLIKQPIAVEGEFAKMDDVSKNGLQTASNIAGGALAVMGFGGMKFGKTKTFKFKVNPAAYTPGATKAATLANTVVVDQLAALR